MNSSFSDPLSKRERIQHAVNRLTFGPKPGDVESIEKLGLKKWLNAQLHPESLPENPTLKQRLQARAPTESCHNLSDLTPADLRREFPSSGKLQSLIVEHLSEAKLLRAIYSTHQLEELLVDFWFNHFNVSWNKGADRYFVPAYERDVIRPNVFGKFYDLLLATAESPAMLFYLDNWRSTAAAPPDDKKARRAQQGLNENYGRELLELHTLGVDGGYTQKDVVEVARCFTGWTIERPGQGGKFQYNDKLHDKGQKIVLGHAIAGGRGMDDGLQVLHILSHEPATARFISLKLARRFLADNPPASVVARMSKTFLDTDGNLREVVKMMITSREFWSKGAYQAKIKMPLEMVASAVRATGVDVTSASALANEVTKLGEPLYRRIDPAGYSSANAEWVNSAALLERMNFGLALTRNRVAGVSVLPPDANSSLNAPGLALGSPDFQRR